MPLFWVNIPAGTAATAAVSIWSSPTMGNHCLGQTYTATSGLYQAVTNLTNQTVTTAAIGSGLWYLGDDQVNSQEYYALAQGRVVICRERTEAERIAQEQAMRAARAAQEERNRLYNAALAKSRELLLECLSPAQRKTFETKNWFVVKGGKTKVQYRIRTETYAGNIDVMDGSKVTAHLCVHCSDVPLYDHHVTQKLMLEYDEESLLKVANRTWVA